MSYDRKFRPQLGHWNKHYVLFQDGSLGTTFHIAGQNAELMDEAALIQARANVNQLALSTASPRLQWWEHFTRIGGQTAAPLQPNVTWWSRSFDDAVDRNCMSNIHRNDLFFTVIVRPRSEIAAALVKAFTNTVGSLFTRRSRSQIPQVAGSFLEEVHATALKTMGHFAHLGIRQLGLIEDPDDGVWRSEVWEAHHLIGNGFFRRIPAANGFERAGRQIIPARPIFGHQEYQIVAEGPPHYAAIQTFINYPSSTHPLMFDKLTSANFDLTITNSFFCSQSQRAIKAMISKERQMGAGGDSPDQAAEVAKHKRDLQSSLSVIGKHHWQLTVRASNLAALNGYVYEAEEMVAKAGATISRCDDKTLFAAFHAQFPGNGRWRTRRGNIPALNFASFAALNNVPNGTKTSRWGGPLFYIRTTRDTLFPYHFHVTGDPNIPKEDVGNFITTGGMGSGKTSHTTRKMVAAGRLGARCIGFDKDCGMAPTFLANDGEYFVLEDGSDTGISLLRGLADTPEDHAFGHQFLLGLIESDGRGGILSGEDAALSSQIQFQLSLPVSLRSIAGIWPLLGSGENGAGSRLRKWSYGERLGWAFDGLTDRFNPYVKMLGVDTTALLQNPLVCQPMLTLLFYRIKKITYQRRPLVITLDECWQTIGKKDVTGSAVDNSRFVGVFNDLSKTIRKLEGIIGLITQSTENLLTSAMKASIIQNFPTKEFFGDRSAQAEYLIDGFSLTHREFHIVKHVLPNLKHALLINRPGGSLIGRNDMSGIPGKVAVLSGRRVTYDLTLALIDKFGNDSRLWVPHYEVLAPLLVDDPKLDPHDLIEGRTRYIQDKVATG